MTAPRFDLVDLRLFVAISEAGSVTAGAARVHLAVASASERLLKLEAALGVSLFRRQRRGVELTPAGVALLDHARLVLQSVESLQGELAAFAKGAVTSVRLLANTSAYVEHLPAALASFLAAQPGVTIDVEERESADIALAVASGAADLGIAVRDALPGQLAQLPFCEDRLVLVAPASSPLPRRRALAFAHIAQLPLIGLPQTSALQSHLGQQAARLGLRLNVRARLTDFTAICRMVEAGAGMAVVPEAAAKRCRRHMAIKYMRLSDSWSIRSLVICARDFKALPAPARALAEHLRRAASPASR